jgi:uncharacterized protein (TIGR02266 family)
MRVWCEGDNVTLFGRVGNLSEGGLFVHTGTPFDAGMRAGVRLKDEGTGGELAASVMVVWSRELGDGQPAGMGMKFEPFDERLAQSIRELLTREQAKRSPQ